VPPFSFNHGTTHQTFQHGKGKCKQRGASWRGKIMLQGTVMLEGFPQKSTLLRIERAESTKDNRENNSTTTRCIRDFFLMINSRILVNIMLEDGETPSLEHGVTIARSWSYIQGSTRRVKELVRNSRLSINCAIAR
jgi:hypothetical protein